jgi:hypothetical protein
MDPTTEHHHQCAGISYDTQILTSWQYAARELPISGARRGPMSFSQVYQTKVIARPKTYRKLLGYGQGSHFQEETTTYC